MRTTIQIPDGLFDDLMAITKADSRTAAIQTAVEHFVRRSRLERLRALRGKLDMVGTELTDQADVEEQLERSSS
ncbi:MAG: type II toxin-antitoxin system VapB family antitoxin [Trueperaceae bacterium]